MERIRKRLKPEIVTDFMKTIATCLTLYTLNIIPYSINRAATSFIQKDYATVVTIIIVEC